MLWDSSANNAAYKSLLLKRAAQSLLLIDKSKFHRSGEVRIGNLRDVTQIISDAGPDNTLLPFSQALAASGLSPTAHTTVNICHPDEILSQIINAYLYLQGQLIFLGI